MLNHEVDYLFVLHLFLTPVNVVFRSTQIYLESIALNADKQIMGIRPGHAFKTDQLK